MYRADGYDATVSGLERAILPTERESEDAGEGGKGFLVQTMVVSGDTFAGRDALSDMCVCSVGLGAIFEEFHVWKDAIGKDSFGGSL